MTDDTPTSAYRSANRTEAGATGGLRAPLAVPPGGDAWVFVVRRLAEAGILPDSGCAVGVQPVEPHDVPLAQRGTWQIRKVTAGAAWRDCPLVACGPWQREPPRW